MVYLNHIVNLDFFDLISVDDQVGLLMDSSGDNRKSFLQLTGYLRKQGAVGMITNLQSGMTLFLKPSGHWRAQMYNISSQAFKTWCLVTAWRIAAESKSARISAEVHANARIAVEAKAESAAREFAASHLAGVDAIIAQEAVAKAEAIMKLAAEAKADPSPSIGHSTNIYGHSQQYYHHQEKYVAFLQELLSDIKRFSSFPRHSDGKVIVDTHPNFASPRPSEVIGNKKCQ